MKSESMRREPDLPELKIFVKADDITGAFNVGLSVKEPDGVFRPHRLRDGFATRANAHRWIKTPECYRLAVRVALSVASSEGQDRENYTDTQNRKDYSA